MIGLDASAAVDWLLETSAGQHIETRIYSRKESLHGPQLLEIEVAQVLRRLVRQGTVAARRADEAIDDLMDLPMTRYPHAVLLPRVWQLRHALSAYDALYVALAEVLDAPLLTCDGRIASAPGHHAVVEVV